MSKVLMSGIDKFLQSCPREEVVFHETEMVVSYKLPWNFTVTGRAACVNSEEFDLKKGRELCHQDAMQKLYVLESYANAQFEHKKEGQINAES